MQSTIKHRILAYFDALFYILGEILFGIMLIFVLFKTWLYFSVFLMLYILLSLEELIHFEITCLHFICG